MSFGLWHWLIVVAISAVAFRRQLSGVILYLTDPGRALKHRLGMLDAKDREAMIRRQAKMREELSRKAWIIIVAIVVLIFVWKVASYWTAPTHS